MIDFKTKSGTRYHTELHGREEILCKNGVAIGRIHRVVRLEVGRVPLIDYYRDGKELWTFTTRVGDEVEVIYKR